MIIVDAERPTKCHDCPFYYDDLYCKALEYIGAKDTTVSYDGIKENCPINDIKESEVN